MSERHPVFHRVSNPQSQQAIGRRLRLTPRSHRHRPLRNIRKRNLEKKAEMKVVINICALNHDSGSFLYPNELSTCLFLLFASKQLNKRRSPVSWDLFTKAQKHTKCESGRQTQGTKLCYCTITLHDLE